MRFIHGADQLASHLKALHKERSKVRGQKRSSPKGKVRDAILQKTDAHCHICGGDLSRDKTWAADHVVPHILNGSDLVKNYLPACRACNGLRWFYSPEEIQWILKLGVWFRTRIEERKDRLAMKLAERFVRRKKR